MFNIISTVTYTNSTIVLTATYSSTVSVSAATCTSSIRRPLPKQPATLTKQKQQAPQVLTQHEIQVLVLYPSLQKTPASSPLTLCQISTTSYLCLPTSLEAQTTTSQQPRRMPTNYECNSHIYHITQAA